MKQYLLNYSLAIFIAALSDQTALAASSPWQDSAGGPVRIVVAEPAAGETNIRAVLQVNLAPGWKTYWRDPGDAGVPPQFDLSGSENVELAALQFPAPLRFDDGVTNWAGYKEPVSIGVDLTRTDATKAMRLKGSVFLGVCEKICVPVKVEFDVPLADAMTSNEDQQLVASAYAALPMAASATSGVTSVLVNDKHLIINAATLAQSPYLYLAAPRGWQFGAPKLVSAAGGKAEFEAAVLYAPKDGVQSDAAVNYTLVTGEEAVSGTVSLLKK